MNRKLLIAYFVVTVLAALPGFAAPTKQKPKKGSAPAKQRAIPRLAATPAPRLPMARLTPLPSGPGVILGDPVETGATAGANPSETRAFGAGCARWLQLELSNHLELGKMPQWTEYATASAEARWTSDGLSTTDAARLAQRAGVTHAVAGRIQGDRGRARLSLQLLSLPGARAVGEPIVLEGSFEEINVALPGAARSLLAALKIHAGEQPGVTAMDVATLINCGRVPLDAKRPLPPGARRTLKEATPAVALARMLVWRVDDGIPTDLLLGAASKSDNLAEKAFVAGLRSDRLEPLSPRLTSAMQDEAPNYLLAFIEAKQAARSERRQDEQAAYERAARSMPGNAAAWLALADSFSARAQDIRQGRVASEVNETEWGVLNRLYGQWDEAAARATRVDPHNAAAWLEFSSAAVFCSDNGTGRAAFWQAQSLDPDNAEIYRSGLDMFQPKWAGDPADLRRIAKLAVATRPRRRLLCGSVMKSLAQLLYSGADDAAIVQTVFEQSVLDAQGFFSYDPATRAALSAAWKATRARPRDKTAWRDFTECVTKVDDDLNGIRSGVLSGAEADMVKQLHGFRQFAAQRWTALDPGSAAAWLALSQGYAVTGVGYMTGLDQIAEQRALSLAPRDFAINKWSVTRLLPTWGADREEVWPVAARIAADSKLLDAFAPNLVAVLPPEGQRSAAQQKLAGRIAAKVEELKTSENADIQAELARAFHRTGRVAEAQTAFSNWARLKPADPEPLFWLGQIQFGKKDMDGAMGFYRRALEVDPNYAVALYYLVETRTTYPKVQMVHADFAEPEELLRRLVVLCPHWDKAWWLLASILDADAKWLEAREAYVRYRAEFRSLGRTNSRAMSFANERLQFIEDTKLPAPVLSG